MIYIFSIWGSQYPHEKTGQENQGNTNINNNDNDNDNDNNNNNNNNKSKGLWLLGNFLPFAQQRLSSV